MMSKFWKWKVNKVTSIFRRDKGAAKAPTTKMTKRRNPTPCKLQIWQVNSTAFHLSNKMIQKNHLAIQVILWVQRNHRFYKIMIRKIMI